MRRDGKSAVELIPDWSDRAYGINAFARRSLDMNGLPYPSSVQRETAFPPSGKLTFGQRRNNVLICWEHWMMKLRALDDEVKRKQDNGSSLREFLACKLLSCSSCLRTGCF
ncbi:hypothetical protein MLD38_013335 [Melastoma candidum]|uniref:Uncharacterized protein n=1 Tax=Melastoma candidum TaxID=119954 RepID=A0ACB9RCW7_9MYRT|nr:hypothetical protein MLD38_013335 [Melastoma candidum]